MIPISPASPKSSTRTHSSARLGREPPIRSRTPQPISTRRNSRRRCSTSPASRPQQRTPPRRRPQITQLLQGMVTRCGGDINHLKNDLANWFDNGMDRLSGRFKRRTQWMTFVVALIAAFVANLDTFRVATLLWEQPALAEKVKLASIEEPRATDSKGAIENGEHLVAAINKLAQEGFPV